MKILARLSDNGKTEANLEVTPTGLTKTQKGGQVAMIKITLEWGYASLKFFNFEGFFLQKIPQCLNFLSPFSVNSGDFLLDRRYLWSHNRLASLMSFYCFK